MIRHESQYAGGDTYAFFSHERLNRFDRWLNDAAATFTSVRLAEAAVRMIERRWGPVTHEQGLAVGWIVGVAMDLTRERERVGHMTPQHAFETAWNDAKTTCVNGGLTRLYRLPPHALPQVEVMAKHIHQSHF